MGKSIKHVEGRTKAARVAVGKTLGPLRNLTVQPKTKERYEKARQGFYAFLRMSNLALPRQREALDSLLSEYLEHLWSTGEGRGLASDTLAGLQDFDPKLRGHLHGSWRLMKAWAVNEVPNRAAPIPESLLQAMIGWSIFHNHHLFALSLMIGFYGLLRTGELFDLQSTSIAMASPQKMALISLGLTKSGKRQGAAESVTIQVSEVLRRLWQWKTAPKHLTALVPSGSRWRQLFTECLVALEVSDFGFRPYSLRRGGATFWFSKHGSFDKLLVQGRWQAVKTARIYLNEGMALLAELKLPQQQVSVFQRIYHHSISHALPELEQTSKGGSTGGRGKSKVKQRGKGKKCVNFEVSEV